MRSAIIVLTLVGLLLVCAGLAYWAWRELGDVEIGMHGWIALGLGAAFTFLVGAGLMALMFFSARRGYDERAHEADRTLADQWRRPPDQD
jgi:hypothetical protein